MVETRENTRHKGDNHRRTKVTNFIKNIIRFVAYNFRFIEMNGGKLRQCVGRDGVSLPRWLTIQLGLASFRSTI